MSMRSNGSRWWKWKRGCGCDVRGIRRQHHEVRIEDGLKERIERHEQRQLANAVLESDLPEGDHAYPGLVAFGPYGLFSFLGQCRVARLAPKQDMGVQ